jgi:hypothetical protein
VVEFGEIYAILCDKTAQNPASAGDQLAGTLSPICSRAPGFLAHSFPWSLASRYARYAYGMDEVWKRYEALP